MEALNWRAWAGIICVTILVAAATWTALNVGRMLYADWSFLHMIRVNTELQQRQAPQQPAPGQGK